MTELWPPLDTHAHVEAGINPTDLLSLRAAIFAATRTLPEFETTLSRADPVTVWGVGVHPKVPIAFESFSVNRFEQSIGQSPLVSEVGLDRNSPVPMSRQQNVLEQILMTLREQPRIVSIHSVGATREVLDLIEEHTIVGVVLHWWRGTRTQTNRAIALGCRFSVNQCELERPTVIDRVPIDRILTETDFPYGGGDQAVPGSVATIEEAIAEQSQMSPAKVRRTIWANLAMLVDETDTWSLFTGPMRRMLVVAHRMS